MNGAERLNKVYAYLVGKQKVSSKKEFSQTIGFNDKNISSALNGSEKYLTNSLFEKIAETFTELNKNWLVFGEGEMLVSDAGSEVDAQENDPKMYQVNPFLNGKQRQGKEPVKYYDVDFQGGSGVVFYEDNVEFPSYEMNIPAFSGCTAFNVFGKSMEPLIDSGSICFGRKIENWLSFIEYGQIYGIILKDGRRMIKRIRKSEDKNTYIIKSENPEFDEDTIEKTLIKNIWLIEGWMLKNT